MSVQTRFSEILWIQGELEINLETNTSGTLSVTFSEVSGDNYFLAITETYSLLDNTTQSFQLLVTPKILTLPGEYSFNLTLSILNSENEEILKYNETFETILGMGYLVIMIFFPLLVVALIIVGIKTKKPIKKSELSEGSTEKEYVDTTGTPPPGKIKCPTCYKIINEGLAFCPECGNRIPEFLQRNPNG
jgi:hypothetical protein